MITSSPPTVSVCMITYNHEKYIVKAIESIISQKTTLPFELIIGDDCSSDNTRFICLDYQERYPEIVRVNVSEKNLGMTPNLLYTLKSCKGKYIALCEGDDYWVDQYKLEKQVKLMEENQNCSFSVHPCFLHKSDNNKNYTAFYKGSHIIKFDAQDVLAVAGQFAPSASYIMRGDVIENLPSWFSSLPIGDFFLEMNSLKYGFGLYMPDVMSAYRVFSVGSWSDRMRKDNGKLMIDSDERMLKYLGYLEEDESFSMFDFSSKKSAALTSIALGCLLQKEYTSFAKMIEASCDLYSYSSITQRGLYYLRATPQLALILYRLKQMLYGIFRVK